MIDPKSNVAKQLAEALKHHQGNLAANQEAANNLERLKQMAARLQEMAEESSDEGDS